MNPWIWAIPIFVAQAGNAAGPSLWDFPWIPFAMIGVMFYFLLIRPERKKRSQTNSMLESLKKNDRVVTIGGIHGVVVNVQQGVDEVTLRVDESSNTKLRVSRSAISRVLTDEDSSETKDAG